MRDLIVLTIYFLVSFVVFWVVADLYLFTPLERYAQLATSITIDLPSGNSVVLSGEGRFEALEYFGEEVDHAD